MEKIRPVPAPTLVEWKQIIKADYHYARRGEHPAPVTCYPLTRLASQGYDAQTNRTIYIFCELPKPDLFLKFARHYKSPAGGD